MPSVSGLVIAYSVLLDDDLARSDVPLLLSQGRSFLTVIVLPLIKHVTGILQRTWSLKDVVLALSDSLCSTIDHERTRAVSLLANIVLQSTQLDRQSTQTLATFFTDKLGDTASLIPATTGLAALTQSTKFGVGEAIQVMRG